MPFHLWPVCQEYLSNSVTLSLDDLQRTPPSKGSPQLCHLSSSWRRLPRLPPALLSWDRKWGYELDLTILQCLQRQDTHTHGWLNPAQEGTLQEAGKPHIHHF